MKTPGDRWLMFLAAIAIGFVVASVVFERITDQRRTAALARMKLHTTLTRRIGDAATSNAAPEKGEQPGAGDIPSGTRDPKESVAAFTQLFAKARAVSEDPRWQDSYFAVLVEKPPSHWSPEELVIAKAFAGAAKEVVREIREQAELGGPAKVLDYSQGASVELLHLHPLRTCAWLLLIDAKVESQLGSSDEVTEDLLALFKLGNVVKDERVLISQLVRCAIDNIAFDGAGQTLPSSGLSPESARRVIQAAGAIHNHENFAESFSGEGMAGLDTFERLRDRNVDYVTQILGDVQDRVDGASNGLTKERVFATVYSSVFARPWLNMDETAYSETMMRARDAAHLPFDEARPVMQQLERDVADMPRTRVLTRKMALPLTKAIAAQARDEAFLALVRVGLAVELYHSQNGAYPPTMDAMSSIVGGKIPVDPFNGQGLGYKAEDQSFVLYSVGHDLVDNDGQQGYKGDGQLDLLTGDIVWRALPKPDAGK